MTQKWLKLCPYCKVKMCADTCRSCPNCGGDVWGFDKQDWEVKSRNQRRGEKG